MSVRNSKFEVNQYPTVNVNGKTWMLIDSGCTLSPRVLDVLNQLPTIGVIDIQGVE